MCSISRYDYVQMYNRQSVSLKIPCLTVGVCHLIIIGLCLYERIWELVKLEEPFHIQEYTFVLTSYGIQSLSIFLLIFGSITGNSYFSLPWLVCTTPLFFSATIYAFFYAKKEETSQILLNFLAVGVAWFTWSIVIKFHLENKRLKAQ